MRGFMFKSVCVIAFLLSVGSPNTIASTASAPPDRDCFALQHPWKTIGFAFAGAVRLNE